MAEMTERTAQPADHPQHEAGIHPSLAELRRLRRDAMGPGNRPANLVSNLFPGAYRSRYRGRGIEFDETRGYHWGDDYRSLDWRVTARTGQMHTKLFHEEREHSLYLVLDAGPSMQFGSRLRYKWVQAARAAALLAWLTAENGDRVGALVFGDGPRPHYRPPAGGEPGVLQLLRLLADLRPQPDPAACSLADALLQLRHRARPGSLILPISDFSALDAAARRHLSHLARHAELAAIQVFDTLEAELPAPGLYPISDGREQSLLDSADPARRRAYAAEFLQHRERVKSTLSALGARLLSLAAHQPTAETLLAALRPSGPRGA